MIRALLISMAVEDGLPASPGAAPWGVLSRQLPRLMVSRLNAGGDRGIRFLPFIGNQGGQRCFLRLSEMLPLESLRGLLGNVPLPELIVDGMISADALHLRVLDTGSGREVVGEDLDFDPLQPELTLRRALFEITGALRWTGGIPSLPDLDGEALGWFLCAHDELLALDAELMRPEGARPLAAARKAWMRSPESAEVREVLLDTCATMARLGLSPEVVGDTVWEAANRKDEVDTEFLFRAGTVLEACDRSIHAGEVYTRAARLQPDHRDACLKAAHLHFAAGRLDEARDVLQRCIEAAGREPDLVARLAAVEERLGHLAERDRLFDELLEERSLAPEVARLLLGYLLGAERYGDALRIVERALAEHPHHPGLLLDRARGLLFAGDGDAARADLESCLEKLPTTVIEGEARRLLRLTSEPAVLGEMLSIERALQNGESRRALAGCRSLVRRNRSLAEAWLLLGTVHQKLRHVRRATRALRRALFLDSRLGEAHNRLGILLVGRGRYGPGYRHLIRAAGELPADPAPRIHLAQACHFLGRPDEGRSHLEEAVRLGGDAGLVATVRERFFG